MGAGFRRVSRALDQMRSDTKGLSVWNVDCEAISYAAEIVETLGGAESVFEDLADLILERQEASAWSLAQGSEAFLRGLLGDPLGLHKEKKAQDQQFEIRRRKIMERYTALKEKRDKLDAEELSIRASLSRKYKREFPQLAGGSSLLGSP